MTIHDEIERIRQQEERLQFEAFDHDLAYQIGTALGEEALARGEGLAIDIWAFGQTLFHLAMAGATPDNEQWINRKRAVVLRFHRSSFRVGRELAERELTISERYHVDPYSFTAHGGSFPVRLRGSGVIGAITVSGLPQAEDHALVVSVLERFVGA
jgi:uncharacterized protein (UPF0303 family)